MSGQATLRDIAERINLSVSAVWRSLADDPQISEQTKQRVREISRQLNYRPRPYRRSRRTRAAVAPVRPALRHVAMVLVGTNTSNELATSLAMVCNELAMSVKLEMAVVDDRDLAGQKSRVQQLAAEVEGLLLCGRVPVELMQYASTLRAPAVMMGQLVAGPDVPASVGYQVTMDGEAMGRLATRALWNAGHRRIAFMAEKSIPNLWNDNWLAGYRTAMATLAGAIDPALAQLTGHLPNPAAAAAARAWAQLDQPPTALVMPSYSATLLAEMKLANLELTPDAIVIGATQQVAQRYGLEDRPLILVDPDAYARACMKLLNAIAAGLAPPPGRYVLPFECRNLPLPLGDREEKP